MGRFLCCLRNKPVSRCRSVRQKAAKRKLAHALCVMAICALLLAGRFSSAVRQEAQPVFFSLLFAQLAPEWTQEELLEDVRWWEAMFL